jgi:LacI family transcriptional regulator
LLNQQINGGKVTHQQPPKGADSSEQKPHVTQKDVARHAGVSPSIVSYVVNDGPRSVSEETRQRVLQAIKELGYRPNKHAQMLIRKKWGAESLNQFGVVLGGDFVMIQHPFYGTILSGIYQAARESGQRLHFVQFFSALKDPVFFNQLIHPEEISGLILLSIHQGIRDEGDQELLVRIVERVGNVVCAETKWGDLPAVVVDLKEAAQTAVSHLINLGHRHIGYVGGPDSRVTGYRNALLEHGLTYDPDLVIHPGIVNIASEGYEGAAELLALPQRPTAVFAANDEVAIGVLRCFQRNGVRVPDDIALVGFDNIQISSYLTPALTTVHVPKMKLGVHAVRMMVDQATRKDDLPISLVLPTELVIRESCGAHS